MAVLLCMADASWSAIPSTMRSVTQGHQILQYYMIPGLQPGLPSHRRRLCSTNNASIRVIVKQALQRQAVEPDRSLLLPAASSAPLHATPNAELTYPA